MIEKDEDGNPIRAFHLTPEQLRDAYRERPLNDVFARLAATRLAMLRHELRVNAYQKDAAE